MTTQLPPDMKERIRASTDIVRLVSRDVELQQRNGVFWGCCPFHAESTASFKVDPERQRAHCFGCGVDVDVFGYVGKKSGLGFREVLEKLGGVSVAEVLQDWPEGMAREIWEKLSAGDNSSSLEWLQARGLDTSAILSGVASLGFNRSLYAFPSFRLGVNRLGNPYTLREWIKWMVRRAGVAACASPWRNAITNAIEGMSFQFVQKPADLASDKLYPIKLSKHATGTPRGYGFAGTSLRSPTFVLCEGRFDTLFMEACLSEQLDITCAGALDAGEMSKRWPMHLTRRTGGRVIVVPHLDADRTNHLGQSVLGPGPAAAKEVVRTLRSAGLTASFFDWPTLTQFLVDSGHSGSAPKDLGDVAMIARSLNIPFPELRDLICGLLRD